MPTKIENALHAISDYDSSFAQNIADQLENKKYLFVSKNKQPQKVEHDSTVLVLLQEIAHVFHNNYVISSEVIKLIEDTSTKCLKIMEELIFFAPKGIDVCRRNPLQELSQLIRIVFKSLLHGNSVPFVVPVCPDLNGYSLREGLWRGCR